MIKVLFFLCIVVFPLSGYAEAVKKCQDANGQWHYGNYASNSCVSDNVTELLEDGRSVEVRVILPSNEELAAERDKKEEEKNRQIKEEEKKRIDAELLTKYKTPENLISIRDQKIEELEKKKFFNQSQLDILLENKSKRSKPKNEIEEQELHELEQVIGRFERAITQTEYEINNVMKKYNDIITRFSEIGQ